PGSASCPTTERALSPETMMASRRTSSNGRAVGAGAGVEPHPHRDSSATPTTPERMRLTTDLVLCPIASAELLCPSGQRSTACSWLWPLDRDALSHDLAIAIRVAHQAPRTPAALR